MLNEGTLAFTAGTNLLSGDVTNAALGEIVLSGGSDTTFDGDLLNQGTLNFVPLGTAPDGSTLTILGNYSIAASGSLFVDLLGSANGLSQSYLTVAGDVELGGLLSVDLFTTPSSPLAPQDGDVFTLIQSSSTLSGAFNALALPSLGPGLGWMLDYSNSAFSLVVTDDVAIGADFNGDGIVDSADLDIWRNNFGIDMGATGLMGDADGNGTVDSIDYFLILNQLGGPGMPGAGSLLGGDLGGPTAVPEPATAVLALVASLGGLALVRRKR